jgi:hypothetical protein
MPYSYAPQFRAMVVEEMTAGPPSLSDWVDDLQLSAAEAHAEAATLRAQYEWDQDTPAIDDIKRRLRVPPATANAAAAAVRLSGNAQQAQRYVAALELSSKPSDAELAQAVEDDGLYEALKARMRPIGLPRVADTHRWDSATTARSHTPRGLRAELGRVSADNGHTGEEHPWRGRPSS